MAHFAKLDDNNVVVSVIVVSNDSILDEHGNESETIGINFCKNLLGQDTLWKQTSYNGRFRKHYAAIGSYYDPKLDAFISPKPYPSWLLNVDTAVWEAPVLYPADGKDYQWDETALSWILV